ncbi:hypothetical protein B0H13DRAFT_1870475 [Mycena leptocephala]|nr:hypothetical protein B0H13DRAFT_1870475 [Mycena leptocephala]
MDYFSPSDTSAYPYSTVSLTYLYAPQGQYPRTEAGFPFDPSLAYQAQYPALALMRTPTPIPAPVFTESAQQAPVHASSYRSLPKIRLSPSDPPRLLVNLIKQEYRVNTATGEAFCHPLEATVVRARQGEGTTWKFIFAPCPSTSAAFHQLVEHLDSLCQILKKPHPIRTSWTPPGTEEAQIFVVADRIEGSIDQFVMGLPVTCTVEVYIVVGFYSVDGTQFPGSIREVKCSRSISIRQEDQYFQFRILNQSNVLSITLVPAVVLTPPPSPATIDASSRAKSITPAAPILTNKTSPVTRKREPGRFKASLKTPVTGGNWGSIQK